MSDQNIGGIAWTVDADTSPAVSSIKQFDNTVDKTTATLKTLDTKVKQSAAAINQNMRNIGYQITDIGVQLAPILGANGIVLAGIQQLSQIGQIFNPLAAGVFALAGAFAGPFLSSLFESESAADKLEESINALNEIVVTSENGVNALSNEYAALAKKSAAAAQSMLLLAKVNAQDVLIRTADEASNAITKFDTLFNAMEVAATQGAIGKLDEAMQRTGKSVTDLLENTDLYGTGLTQLQSAAEQLNDKFGITTDKSVEIIRLFEQFKKNRTTETFNNLAEGMARIATEAGDKATPEFIKMVAKVAKLSLEAATAEEKIKLLNEAIAGGKVATEESVKSTEKYSDLLDRLTVRSEKLRSEQLKREKQLTLEKAAEDGVSESMRNSIAAAYDKLIANEQMVESERAKAKAIAEANKKQREEDRKATEERRREKEKERELNKITDKAETVAGKYGDPLAELEAQKEQELEALRKAEEAGLQLHTEYAALRAEIDSAYQEKRMAAMVEMFENESELNATILSSIDALGSASKNVFKSIIDGSFSARDAALTFANAILDEVINSIVSIGVEYAKNALVMSAIDQSQMASKQAMQAANAAQHTAAVSATVAELASLGAAAAMASTAAIPIVGPGIAPAAGAAMAGLITATGAPAIASAPIAGAREHGGSVMANSLYEVGEKNKPELLMIPGNNGKVFSNAEMRSFMNGGSGGGSAPIVNIHNYSGAPVETRTSGGLTEQQVIDIIIGQTSNGNTRAMRNITRLTSATNNAAANRR